MPASWEDWCRACSSTGRRSTACWQGRRPASDRGVYEAFRPKVPRLMSPSNAEPVTAFSNRASTGEGITAGVGTQWSDDNHKISGLFVVIMAMLALASRTGEIPWARHTASKILFRWWGFNSTLSDRHRRNRSPGPDRAEETALDASESRDESSQSYTDSTRPAQPAI